MLGAYVLAGCDAICRLARGKFRAGKQALALLALGGRVQVCAVAHRFHAERGVEVDALRVQQALAEDARRAAHERAAADHGEAIVGREGFLVARAEAGSLEERIDDGRRGVVVDGEVAAVMQIVGSFTAGTVAQNLVGFPSTDYKAHTIMTHAYDYGWVRYEMGYASAICMVLFVAMYVCNRLISKVLSKYMD